VAADDIVGHHLPGGSQTDGGHHPNRLPTLPSGTSASAAVHRRHTRPPNGSTTPLDRQPPRP